VIVWFVQWITKVRILYTAAVHAPPTPPCNPANAGGRGLRAATPLCGHELNRSGGITVAEGRSLGGRAYRPMPALQAEISPEPFRVGRSSQLLLASCRQTQTSIVPARCRPHTPEAGHPLPRVGDSCARSGCSAAPPSQPAARPDHPAYFRRTRPHLQTMRLRHGTTGRRLQTSWMHIQATLHAYAHLGGTSGPFTGAPLPLSSLTHLLQQYLKP
jgi:hypothetical protein